VETTSSSDGTIIAYDSIGTGPALIVCVGALCDRHTFAPPAELTGQFTVYTYDRRGRGDSGDTRPYAPEREYEDLAAVAAAAGGTPFVYGHSSGGAIALRAAASGVAFAGIAAYEAPFLTDDAPSVDEPDPAEYIRELVRTDRRGEALVFWMREVVHAPADVAEQMATAPWAKPSGGRARLLDGYDHRIPAEAITPILIDIFRTS
jgi:pimeloyl-ACP methyl ester carboxylesterase